MTSLLDPPVIRDFAGELLVPGDAGCEERRPALIARCTGRDDVAAALRHARERGLRVSVGAARGALMLDLGRMRGVYVDPVRRRARVQAGASWRELDAATQVHGLAVTGARVAPGAASGGLVSARMVTADGDVVTASADEHPELFRGLRGGGAGLGVVVELEFALAPVGPTVVGGMLGWPAERICEVAAFYGPMMREAPEELGGGLLLARGPQAGPTVSVVVSWTGPSAGAEAHLAPLRLLGPALDTVGPLPYAACRALLAHAPAANAGGGFLTSLPSGDLDVPTPPPRSSVLFQPLGACSAPWHWQAAGQDAAALDWAAGVRRALAPWAAFPERFAGLRADWDPGGLLSVT